MCEQSRVYPQRCASIGIADILKWLYSCHWILKIPGNAYTTLLLPRMHKLPLHGRYSRNNKISRSSFKWKFRSRVPQMLSVYTWARCTSHKRKAENSSVYVLNSWWLWHSPGSSTQNPVFSTLASKQYTQYFGAAQLLCH